MGSSACAMRSRGDQVSLFDMGAGHSEPVIRNKTKFSGNRVPRTLAGIASDNIQNRVTGGFDRSMQHHLMNVSLRMVSMTQGKWSRLSPTQRADIWIRWKAGQTLHEIGRAYGKPHPTIRKVLLPRGGIPPIARRRSRLALTLAEREDISRGIASGGSMREIARHLDRSASTVSREVARHGGCSAYRAHEADDQVWDSALRPKRCLLARNRRLRNVVASKLILDWSPEQISGWLKTQYPDDGSMRVSHETIYRSLFIQARGALKKELMEHLRSKRRMRRSRHASEHGQSRGQIVDAISIRERPPEADD